MNKIKRIQIDSMGVTLVYHPSSIVGGYLSRRRVQLKCDAHIDEILRRDAAAKQAQHRIRHPGFSWARFWLP